MRAVLLVILAVCIAAPSTASVPTGAEAYYYLVSSSEGQSPPVKRIRITAGPVAAKVGRWWEMTLEKPDGSVLGLKVLSERVPLSSSDGPGRVSRYIYSPSPGECLEYVNTADGSALLPELRSFERDFFPQAYDETRYTDGFANTGRLLGHILWRYNGRPRIPKVDFSNPKVLRLRSDLMVGAEVDARDDRDESIPKDKREHTPLTREEYSEMISVGANLFHPTKESLAWLRNEPVFLLYRGIHPDDHYRSNFLASRMFTDEPATRFGWGPDITLSVMSPEIAAQAIAMRVEESEHPFRRRFESVADTGTMEALYDPCPSWDTQQYTAYYQLAGGAPGIVFEGRYVKRGYGWSPEWLLGEGLEDLDDKQQYDYFHAFLRGAARRWNAYWGTSVYPEGDRAMMIPALCRAYDQGARCLWFWACDNLPYRWRIEVLKGLRDHIATHPHRANRFADAAIVLPKGYMVSPDGIWWMHPEGVNQHGVSYRDIGATATFEGILLSRSGVEYDYVNDHTGITRAGYKQLVYVREDGRVEWLPKRPSANAPRNLTLKVSPATHAGPEQPAADYLIPRAPKIGVDGNLSDWKSAKWITMQGQPYHFGDNYDLDITLRVPDNVSQSSDQKCLGFTWDQISPDYRRRYLLEGHVESEVVVTSIIPGGAAEQAGLREGDVIHYIDEKWIRWAFEVWGKVDQFKKTPGASVHMKITRNGLDHLGGPTDLSARFALFVDDESLYFAADVTDDVHEQTMPGRGYWQNDSVQIGLDPVLARGDGYGEQGHEFGFALSADTPVAWRWAGRRGQPLGELRSAKCAVVRTGGHTLYEAAIPVSELAPLSPDMWPKVGLCIVVNDSDDGVSRKARLELVPGAMTQGKKLSQFPVFELEPSPDGGRVSAALVWKRRCLKPGGQAELALTLRSPEAQSVTVRSRLLSVDDPRAKAASAEITVPVTPRTTEYLLSARTLSPPGRYRLEVEVLSPDGRTAARDALPVYVYD